MKNLIMSSAVRRTALLCITVLAAGWILPANPARQAVIQNESGQHVVRNPMTPAAGPSGKPAVVSLVEDLVIGKDDHRSDYSFSGFISLRTDSSDRIYTMDSTPRIRVFGPDGALLKAFGRKGTGPGEFNKPEGFFVTPDGRIVSKDSEGRISYFSREGELLDEITTQPGTVLTSPVIDGQSNLYVTAMSGIGTGRTRWEIHKLAPDFSLLSRVYVDARRPSPGLSRCPLLYDVADDGRFAWMVAPDYEIHVIDSEGQPVMTILKETKPQRITKKNSERYWKGYKNLSRLINIELPKNFPAASAILTDEKARLYVRTYEPDGRGKTAVDVFDPRGVYFARFFVPDLENTVKIRNDKLYSIVEDPASGHQIIKRYSMKWE
jgi:hypothetical protein